MVNTIMPMFKASSGFSFNAINTALGRSPTAQFSLNDPDWRAANNSTGDTQLSLSNSENVYLFSYTLSTSTTAGLDVGALLTADGYDAAASGIKAKITITIDNYVTLGGKISGGNGSAAMVVGASTLTTVKIINYGAIIGGGGNGGNGVGATNNYGGPGLPGAHGIVAYSPTLVINMGSISGGGGGGAGGQGYYNSGKYSTSLGYGGGGGGGAGYPGGTGGTGASGLSVGVTVYANAGSDGTLLNGGTGGANAGAGGSYGSNGGGQGLVGGGPIGAFDQRPGAYTGQPGCFGNAGGAVVTTYAYESNYLSFAGTGSYNGVTGNLGY